MLIKNAESLCNPRPENAHKKEKKKVTREFVDSRLEPRERVRVGDAVSALDVWLHARDVCLGRQLPVLGQREGGIKLLVDDTDHAALAVGADGLRAVVPDRVLVLHNDLEDLLALTGGDGEKARKEGLGVAGLARGAEGGFDDRVVLGCEVPLDDVADFRNHVVRFEFQATTAGDHGVGYACQGDGFGGGGGCCAGWRGGHGAEGRDKHKEGVGNHFGGCRKLDARKLLCDGRLLGGVLV
jgi:hypothetical protein